MKSHNLGGYKANMNAYIMASLSLLSSGNLDLSYIWEQQKVQKEVIERINELVPIVWSHLTEGVNGLQSSNASEWSKKTECWNKLKLRLADLEKFGDDLLQKETNEDGSFLNETQQERIREAESYSSQFWFSLANWAKTNDVLTPIDRKAAFNFGTLRSRNKGFASLKQALYALKIVKSAKELGFNE